MQTTELRESPKTCAFLEVFCCLNKFKQKTHLYCEIFHILLHPETSKEGLSEKEDFFLAVNITKRRFGDFSGKVTVPKVAKGMSL